MQPLVEPGPELAPAEVRRYARHLTLPDVGLTGQRRLRNARVLVVGAGGLGSPVLMYLAAAGVGVIGVVDDDRVEESNLQRQVVHGLADLGTPKTSSAARALARLDPSVRVVEHPVRLTRDNVLELAGDYDLVVDGTDNFPTRYLVNDACAILGKPYVWGSIFRFDGQVSVFWAGHGPTYRDLHPEPPPPGAVPSCAEGGVLGVLCGVIGSLMATEAVKLITGVGEPLLGRVLVYDALALTFRTLRLRPDPALAPITELPQDLAFCAVPGAEAEPPAISARELDVMLAARERGEADFLLVDVREPVEAEIVRIEGSVLVPKSGIDAGQGLSALRAMAAGRRVVVHCKSGGRSAQVLTLLLEQGYPDAVHLDGGVLAWVRDVRPDLPAY